MSVENNQKRVSILGNSLFSEKEVNNLVGEIQTPQVLSEINHTGSTWASCLGTCNQSCNSTCYGATCYGCNRPGR